MERIRSLLSEFTVIVKGNRVFSLLLKSLTQTVVCPLMRSPYSPRDIETSGSIWPLPLKVYFINVVYTYDGILFSHEKEGNSDSSHNLNEP